MALTFFREEQIDAIVLGCTELSLIHRQHPDTQFMLIDSTEVLALALIREATLPSLGKMLGALQFKNHHS